MQNLYYINKNSRLSFNLSIIGLTLSIRILLDTKMLFWLMFYIPICKIAFFAVSLITIRFKGNPSKRYLCNKNLKFYNLG